MKKIVVLFCIVIFSLFCNFSYATNNTEALLQYNRGIDYFKLGQYDNAIACFRLSISADPNFIDAYYNLGSTLEYLKQYDAALVVFKRIIVRDPEDYESIYKAAWLEHKLNNNEKAKTYLSLIPEYSSMYENAKELASELNFSLSKSERKKTISDNSSSPISNNAIYENFTAPTGVTSDSFGNVYVAEYSLNSIIKITPENRRMLFIKSPKINGPIGIAMDSSNNLYVANYGSDNILKISQYGALSVLISKVKKPYGLYIKNNILYVTSQGDNSLIKYKL